MGLGYAYKWLSLRIAFPVMPGFKKESIFGISQPFNLAFDFSLKKMYLDFEFKTVKGYAIKDAYIFDTVFSISNPNAILPAVGTLNFSLGAWYFHKNDFKMSALQGKRAHFNKDVHTWYIKSTFNIFGVDNNGNSIIPNGLHDTNNSKTSSNILSSVDFGIIPGYAYAKRINNWQFSGWLGFGPVIQTKFFATDEITQGFVGLAPRYDLKLVGGYTSSKYFILLVGDFDNKSITFNNLQYHQYYYTIKLVGGFRILSKKSKQSTNRPLHSAMLHEA